MNKGMPNLAKLGAKTVLEAYGIKGIPGWLIQQIMVFFGTMGSKELLVYFDKGHMIMVVNGEEKDFDKENLKGWAIVDQGKALSKDEMDAIDKPVLDAFVKFGSFNKLRKR